MNSPLLKVSEEILLKLKECITENKKVKLFLNTWNIIQLYREGEALGLCHYKI